MENKKQSQTRDDGRIKIELKRKKKWNGGNREGDNIFSVDHRKFDKRIGDRNSEF